MFHGKVCKTAGLKIFKADNLCWIRALPLMLFKRFPKNFQNNFFKEHIWQDTSIERYYNHCFIYITGNKNMTKPTFRPRGRPGKSTSCSHNKNVKTYRVWLNRLWFLIHDEVLNFHDWILCYHEPFHKKIKR